MAIAHIKILRSNTPLIHAWLGIGQSVAVDPQVVTCRDSTADRVTLHVAPDNTEHTLRIAEALDLAPGVQLFLAGIAE